MHGILSTPTKRIAALLVLIFVLFSSLSQIRIQNMHSSVLSHHLWSIKEKLSFATRLSSSSFRVAIIGSSGYIGSRLLDYLQHEKSWNVTGYDSIFPGQSSY
jgi:hypothetical protein